MPKLIRMNHLVYTRTLNGNLTQKKGVKYHKMYFKTIPFCSNCLKEIRIDAFYYRSNHKGKLFCKTCFEKMFI